MKFDFQSQGAKAALPLLLAFGSVLSCPPPAFAGSMPQQSKEQSGLTTFNGTVVDTDGEPLIGATVKASGTNIGAFTDIDGNFSIKARPGASLEFSYVGFKPKKVKASKDMKVVMEVTDNSLDEVVVVGFGTQKKITQTGATSQIKSEDLTRTSIASVSNVLAGQLSGVSTVQFSGEPGENTTDIFVRGKATFIDENAKPLIQVDGVERDMWNLDPNEIENITVLKDASATAVFGVRGANGVILVTTKRGIEGKPKINVSLNFSAQTPTKLMKMANSLEYANFYNKIIQSDTPGTGKYFSDEILAKFASNDPNDKIRFPSIRWTDYVMKDVTFQQQHNVSVSGGNKIVRYFVSAGFFYQDGLFDQFGRDDMKFDYRANRFNYRANVDVNVTPTTLVSINVGGNIDNTDKPRNSGGASAFIKGIYSASPFSAAGFDNQGRFILTDNRPEYNLEYDETGDSHVVALPFTGGHPLDYYTGGDAYHTVRNTITTDLIATQKLDIITKNLSLRVKGSYNSGFHSQKTIVSPVSIVFPKVMNDGHLEYLIKSYSDPPTYGGGGVSSSWRNWYIEAALDWNREFGKHNISALALYNQSKNYYPGGAYNDIARGYVGFVGRVTYDYDNRYIAEFNFGYNGSENFAPGKRFGAFPAGSLGWVVTNEKWMEPVQSWLSLLKFRVSLGLVGNDKIGGYRFMYLPDPYEVNNMGLWQRPPAYGYFFGVGNGAATQPGAAQTQSNNPNVTWEKALKQNYAVEINFLNNRLKSSFDYYHEHRKDILLQNYKNSSALLGYTPPMTNFGIVDSWGWELSLGWNDFITSDFSYWAKVNLSFNDNKIVRNGQTHQSYDYQVEEGHRIGSGSKLLFWGYYDETAAQRYESQFGKPLPEQMIPNSDLRNGDPIYVDLNGDGKIDNNDYSLEFGKTNDPRYIIGVMAGLKWKGLSFNAQFTGAWDVSRVIDGAFRVPFWNATGDNKGGLLLTHINNSWSEENPNAIYPRPTFTGKEHSYAESTLWEKNSSYFRCKTMQIAYDFDMPWMKKIRLNQLQLSLSAYNLFTITGYKWGDPENRASRSPDYPLTRTFTLSLKLGF